MENKNKTAETIAGTMSGYGFSIPGSGYDNEDRLVSYNRTDTNLDQSWSLSAVGDWNSITTEGTAQPRTHGPTHEVLTGGGGTVTTDVKGNITLIPSQLRPNSASLLLNWDADNRLNTADVGNNSSIDVTYKFDALGRRVFRDDGTTANVYVQSGQQTIADYVSGTVPGSPTYRYVYASYIDEPVLRYKPTGSESLYYHRNQQYSINALTNSSGSIVERYAYSAYGAPTITSSTGTIRGVSTYDNRYTYTGREWDDDLHLYHYRARMYDADLGRFCSKDPVEFVDGTNVYRMYWSLVHTDPSGGAIVNWSDHDYEDDRTLTVPMSTPGHIPGLMPIPPGPNLPPAPTFCQSAATAISILFLNDPNGQRFWDHFTGGSGKPITLNGGECLGVMFSNPRAIQALRDANDRCDKGSVIWVGTKTSETLSPPWKTSLGGVNSSFSYSCDCCIRWKYKFSDTYDWKSILREYKSHRSPWGQIVTLGFDLAQTLTRCRANGSWKDFPVSGQCSGGDCP